MVLNQNSIINLSACELKEKIKARELSCLQVTTAFLDNIETTEPKIDAFTCLTQEAALKKAKELDGKIASGQKVGELCGLPIAIKDNLHIEGVKTTCSSKILQNYIAPYDAEVITRIKAADAVFVGKTNLDEFAMGSSTENSAFKTTKNPWDTSRIPGGSSGGSAAAVASLMSPFALGSDTGGSIRQPAALCGTVGLKPTYGRVSRYGLVAFASSLDQIGTFSKTTKDTALLLKTIAGHDEKDSTSAAIEVPNYTELLEKNIKGMKIGLPKEYFEKGLDSEVENALKEAIALYKDLGAQFVEVSLPNTNYAIAVYYIVAPCEASANLARYDGVKYGFRAECSNLLEEYEKTRDQGFGAEVKRRIMLGTYALSSGYYDAYYNKAQKARTLIKMDFENAFKKADILLTPTTPTPAFKIGEKSADPLQMYLSDIFTISCNLAGLPGISIPCGFTKNNLPIGMQLLGKPFDEETLLSAAHQYETKTSWHRRVPNV